MAQFLQKFRFKENENGQILFSIMVNEFFVQEHTLERSLLINFMSNWDGISFKHYILTVSKKTDGFFQFCVANNNVRSIYRLSPSEFQRMFAMLRRTIDLGV